MSVTGSEQVAANLRGLAPRIVAAVELGVSRAMLDFAGRVVTQKLSGQVLKRQTGALASSVAASPRTVSNGSTVTGFAGTNVWYGLAHEYGGKYEQHIPEHIAKISQAFGRAIPGMTITIGAHSRHVKYRERSFLRSVMGEMQQEGRIAAIIDKHISEVIT